MGHTSTIPDSIEFVIVCTARSRTNTSVPEVKNPVHKEIELIITLASGHTRSNRNLHFEDNNLKKAASHSIPPHS